jgi:hypothetical protein
MNILDLSSNFLNGIKDLNELTLIVNKKQNLSSAYFTRLNYQERK